MDFRPSYGSFIANLIFNWNRCVIDVCYQATALDLDEFEIEYFILSY